MLKKLPIGRQDFVTLREENCVYIDKTPLIFQLIQEGSTYFLSRPRRFGKSLLLSTLKSIFEGQKALFTDLWIAQADYNWQSFPIIQISFGGAQYEDAQILRSFLHLQLDKIIKTYELKTNFSDRAEFKFRQVIEELSSHGKVVVLIDEYDKPILDTIDNIELSKANQETLKAFYSVIKEVDEYVKFVFITGVSKFAKTGVFSGLNNLNDISMNAKYATLCGYTQAELEASFSEYLPILAESQSLAPESLLEKIRQWYNGYRFSEATIRVYNPFSTLLLFNQQKFSAHWFETGTPTFLLKLIKASKSFFLPDIESLCVTDTIFTSFEIDDLVVEAILYQTGYLTIVNFENNLYTLSYPNHEVKAAFSDHLIGVFSSVKKEYAQSYTAQIIDHLKANNLTEVFTIMKTFFANIPYDLQISQEKYYQTIFYLIFTLIGFRTDAEVKTSDGRIDAVIQTTTDIYIFEFKLDGFAAQALQQIIDKEYALKYQSAGKTIHLVGVEFNHETRNIGEWVTSPS